MFCTKCGSEIDNEIGKCPKCEGVESVIDKKIPVLNEKKSKKGLSIFCFISAFIILILNYLAAKDISLGGKLISQIESVGGRTLEEAYYHDLGRVYQGMSMMIYSCGIFFASILTYLGCKNLKN